MRPKMIFKMAAALGVALLATEACEKPVPKTPQEKVSYGVGVDVARSVKRQGIKLDSDLIIKGLKDEFSAGKLLVPEDDLRKTMVAFQTELKKNRALIRMAASEDNKAKGAAFLTENAKKDGVMTLPSGLQYKVLKEGKGKKPGEADTVVCHFRGLLIDGTELDSSYRTGRPETFKVKGMVRQSEGGQVLCLGFIP